MWRVTEGAVGKASEGVSTDHSCQYRNEFERSRFLWHGALYLKKHTADFVLFFLKYTDNGAAAPSDTRKE